MLEPGCFFVFGVSSVGKTRACESFVTRHPEFLYLRASALLGEARGVPAEALRTTDALEITSNQDVLAKAIMERRGAQPDRPTLIDAHAVINNDHELVRVPVNAIASIRPTGFVLLEGTPEVIAMRRRVKSKPNELLPISVVAEETTAERETVIEYSRALDVPLAIGCTDEAILLDPLIASLQNQRLSRGS